MRATNLNPKTAIMLIIMAVSSIVVTNGILNFLVLSVLWLGIRLLWRAQFSPIFSFIFIYSWIQASIRVFQANIMDVEINQLAVMGGDIYWATVLSLLALASLAIGMRFGLGRLDSFELNEFRSELARRSPLFWFYCYLIALALALILQIVTFVLPGLSQPIIALANLKWAFFWLFTHSAFSTRGSIRWFWFLTFLLEFMIGIGGFFSSFKTVIFFTILGLISSGIRLNARRIAALSALSVILIIFGVAWTAIKGEQRGFLSRGAESQVVDVSFLDSIGNIFELLGNLNAAVMIDTSLILVDRITYVELFGEVLDNVPSQIPYEKGSLWGDAIARPFMPRLFFPEKSIIDESLRTIEYVKREFAGIDQGTQVSLGYIADSYIDFGPWFMMLPILAVGWFMGRFYRWIVGFQWCRGAIGAGLGTATLFQMLSIELSNTKLFGGLLIGMLMSWIVARWIVPVFYLRKVPAVTYSRTEH